MRRVYVRAVLSRAPEAALAGLAPEGAGELLGHVQCVVGRVVVQLVPGSGKQQVLVAVKHTRRARKAGTGSGLGCMQVYSIAA